MGFFALKIKLKKKEQSSSQIVIMRYATRQMKKITVQHIARFINFCEQNGQDKEALIDSYEKFSKIDIRTEIEKLKEIENEEEIEDETEEETEDETENLCDQMMKKLTIDDFITFLKNK